MKSNSLLTYVLYGLLGLFILTAGYYACQKQKEKKEQSAREAAEMEETLRNMGYASEDPTAATGSSFSNNDSLSKSATTTKPTATTTEPTATTPPTTGTKTDTKEKSAPIAKAPTVKVPTSSTSTSEPKKSIAKVSEPGAGRWVVRAGTFTYVEGARTRLEEVIKAGYPNAEISKTKEGMFAVIVYRSNDKEAANRAVEKLQTKNIDAAVFAQK